MPNFNDCFENVFSIFNDILQSTKQPHQKEEERKSEEKPEKEEGKSDKKQEHQAKPQMPNFMDFMDLMANAFSMVNDMFQSMQQPQPKEEGKEKKSQQQQQAPIFQELFKSIFSMLGNMQQMSLPQFGQYGPFFCQQQQYGYPQFGIFIPLPQYQPCFCPMMNPFGMPNPMQQKPCNCK